MKTTSAPAPVVDEDGRRQRSSRSRAQIVQAMFELIRDGDMAPSAARVAETAGVSLRTVFRHFEEMDTLYREMTAKIEAEVLPLFLQPLTARTWRERVDELIARRTDIYERIMPYRVAGSLRRFNSRFLMEDYERFLKLERTALEDVLPKRVIADAMLFSALEMVMAFQAWRRMRQDQRLSVKDARAVMLHTVDRLLDGR